MKSRKPLKTNNTGVGNSVSYGGTILPHKRGAKCQLMTVGVGNATFNEINSLQGTFPTFPTLSYAKSYARLSGVGNVGNTYRVSYVPTPRRQSGFNRGISA